MTLAVHAPHCRQHAGMRCKTWEQAACHFTRRHRNRTAYHYSCRKTAKEDLSGSKVVVDPQLEGGGFGWVPLGAWDVFSGAGDVRR